MNEWLNELTSIRVGHHGDRRDLLSDLPRDGRRARALAHQDDVYQSLLRNAIFDRRRLLHHTTFSSSSFLVISKSFHSRRGGSRKLDTMCRCIMWISELKQLLWIPFLYFCCRIIHIYREEIAVFLRQKVRYDKLHSKMGEPISVDQWREIRASGDNSACVSPHV